MWQVLLQLGCEDGHLSFSAVIRGKVYGQEIGGGKVGKQKPILFSWDNDDQKYILDNLLLIAGQVF